MSHYGPVDYELTRLGGERMFEHLSQTLAVAVLGPGIQVLGDGPDGGREASFSGLVELSDSGESWYGDGVVQAKYRRRPLGTEQDTRWLIQQLRRDFNAWSDPRSRRARQGRVPQYLLVVTNVVLSAVPGSGGIDKVSSVIAEHAEGLGLKDWAIWHYDTICRLLDIHGEVRRAYLPLITPGDVFWRLQEFMAGTAVDVGQQLVGHAAKEMLAKQWVRLGQAGHPDNERLALGQVAIDLPGERMREDSFQTVNVTEFVIERGNAIRRRSSSKRIPPHLLLAGDPGQGKTTLGQLICQVYRVAMLGERPGHILSEEARRLLVRLREDLAALGVPMPTVLRWPFQVSLSEYGDEVAGGRNLSLVRYLAREVSRNTPEEITGSQMRNWLKAWPWILVLDGLDEVASPLTREEVVKQVSNFLVDAANADADLLVVATTRPQGYVGELPASEFEDVRLKPLRPEQSIRYAERLASVRHRDDPDTRTAVLERVHDAVSDELTGRLMRTPLQVTIMSLLLERKVRVPQSRYGLFDAYYQTIYEREVGKQTSFGQLLDEQRNNVHFLHERVGLLLQLRAERDGEADAALPAAGLNRLAMKRLLEEGYDEEDAESLTQQMIRAATNRLVLIVPRAVDHVGFEVRSLQEFMAARALVSGPEDEIQERLRILAPSTHWRNTWLLAAGRTFSLYQHLRPTLLAVLRDIDTDSLLALLVRPGAHLAVELLEDDVATAAPRYQRLLVQHALDLHDLPPDTDLDRLADVLLRLAATDERIRDLAEHVIERALATGGMSVLSALAVLTHLSTRSGRISTWATYRLGRAERDLGGEHGDAGVAVVSSISRQGFQEGLSKGLKAEGRRRLSEIIMPLLNPTNFDQDDLAALERVRRAIRESRVLLARSGDQLVTTGIDFFHPAFADLDAGLSNPRASEALIMAADGVPVRLWAARSLLSRLCSYWQQRKPVGPELEVLMPELADDLTESR